MKTVLILMSKFNNPIQRNVKVCDLPIMSNSSLFISINKHQNIQVKFAGKTDLFLSLSSAQFITGAYLDRDITYG